MKRSERRRRKLVEMMGSIKGKLARKRRCSNRQKGLRQVERSVRMAAVSFRRLLAKEGLDRKEAAARLCVSPRTLEGWERRWRRDRLRALKRGRRLKRSPQPMRTGALRLLRLMGPGTGVPVLWPLLKLWGMGKRELEDLVRRYKALSRKTARRELSSLLWTRAGIVWAADHTEPPHRIEGGGPVVLAVRDLGSSSELLWEDVAERTAAGTGEVLERLFAVHGPPLVIKWDNGGAFNAKETEEMLKSWEVKKLLSPPCRPQYNGAREAGIGSLKRRTEHLASIQGREGQWMSDDLRSAKWLANMTGRPWGEKGPTPGQVWAQREPVSVEERSRFNRVVEKYRSHFRQPEGRANESSIERKAIRSALVECGYLQIRRGRISPLFKSLFRARIS